MKQDSLKKKANKLIQKGSPQKDFMRTIGSLVFLAIVTLAVFSTPTLSHNLFLRGTLALAFGLAIWQFIKTYDIMKKASQNKDQE